MTFENILRGKFTAKIKRLSFHKLKLHSRHSYNSKQYDHLKMIEKYKVTILQEKKRKKIKVNYHVIEKIHDLKMHSPCFCILRSITH
jgi:hypothetical protein